MRRFPNFDREEIRAMFDLVGLRETRAWQEIHEEGVEEGQLLAKQQLVLKWLAKGMTTKEIAELLDVSPKEVAPLCQERCEVSAKRTSAGICPVGPASRAARLADIASLCGSCSYFPRNFSGVNGGFSLFDREIKAPISCSNW